MLIEMIGIVALPTTTNEASRRAVRNKDADGHHHGDAMQGLERWIHHEICSAGMRIGLAWSGAG
jgi:hypothetical protein